MRQARFSTEAGRKNSCSFAHRRRESQIRQHWEECILLGGEQKDMRYGIKTTYDVATWQAQRDWD
jgi:hypothetical protein